jgi:arylsulfatase A-like enzyme
VNSRLLILIAACGCAGPTEPIFDDDIGPLGRNVLILVADDLGTDKVGAYGEHPDAPSTPTLDALARRGVLFRNAYAHPYGTASRSALMTGRYARRVGIGDLALATTSAQLPVSEICLPELLTQSPLSWDTAALGKWNLSGSGSEHFADHPRVQGFRTHRGSVANIDASLLSDPTPRSYEFWEKAIDGALEISATYATTDTTDDAIYEVTAMESPWLAYVAYNAPHVPLHLPPEALRPDGIDEQSSEIEQYNAVISALDQEIGRLFAAMGEDLLAETTVIFLSDNGTDGPFVLPPLNEGHAKTTSFEGGINIPMIVAGPWVAHPGSESQAIVQDIDVFATVAEIASVDTRGLLRQDGTPNPIDGTSLLPMLRDPSAAGRTYGYTERFRPNGAPPYLGTREIVVGQKYKYFVENVSEQAHLYALESRVDDGANLLTDPHGLDDEAATALDELSQFLQNIRGDVRYAGPGS